jgi:hypothetical protein
MTTQEAAALVLFSGRLLAAAALIAIAAWLFQRLRRWRLAQEQDGDDLSLLKRPILIFAALSLLIGVQLIVFSLPIGISDHFPPKFLYAAPLFLIFGLIGLELSHRFEK